MKKCLCVILGLLLIISMCGCSKSSGKYVFLQEDLGVESYAIGFRIGDEELAETVSGALQALVLDGTYEKIGAKYPDVKDYLCLTKDGIDESSLPAKGSGDSSFTFKHGFDLDYPPYSYLQDDGSVGGLDVELCQAVCDYLGCCNRPGSRWFVAGTRSNAPSCLHQGHHISGRLDASGRILPWNRPCDPALLHVPIRSGKDDRRSATDVMHVMFTWGMLIMLGITALLILSAEPLTRLFYRDPLDPVYHMTVMGFRLLPLCMPLALFTLNYACYAQVAEKRAISIILPIFEGALGVVICSLILVPIMGMNGLYISNILNGCICSAVILISVWLTQKRCPTKLEDLLVFSKDFGVNEEERLDISVRTIDDTMTVSRQVIDFCTRRGIDQRRAYYAGLCMEEMAGNVVLHGFTKDQKKHSLDIRVSHTGDDIILRLRDNCISFNPAERAGSRETEDGIKDIGIRLAYHIAKEFQYQNLLGLNVLMMRI